MVTNVRSTSSSSSSSRLSLAIVVFLCALLAHCEININRGSVVHYWLLMRTDRGHGLVNSTTVRKESGRQRASSPTPLLSICYDSSNKVVNG